jgi:hypothetical protein
MERSPLDSSAVRSAGYDDASQVLELEFSNGRIYQFDAVPRAVYDWLLRTPNKGGYVNRMINGRYTHRDITRASQPPQPERDLAQILSDSLRRLEDKPRN